MLTIQIKNGNNEVIAVINDIFSLSVDDEVNKGGKLKLRFPTDSRLQKNPIQKWYRISIVYGEKIGQIIRLFEGYITDVQLKTQEVEIDADNWLSYLQYRIIKSEKKYTNAPISTVVSQIFTDINNTHELPLTLGLNDCSTTITKDFSIGTSFYDILKYCREAEPKLVVRVISQGSYNFLECSENWGNVLEGVREYDAKYTRGTNIVDRSRKDSMDDFYSNIKTATWEMTNEEFIQRTNLLFEKYEENGALALPNGIAIPSIAVSRDTDRRDFNIWDRKNIRLVTGYERLPIQYLGLIQSRKVNINARTWIKAEIKISEEYKSDTNILDLVLQNLRGRKTTSGEAPDLSNYYTKSQTAEIISTSVATKADIVHTHLVNQITDFASAVGTLISTALVWYITSGELTNILSNYSLVGHTHMTSDILDFTEEVNDLIAEGLSGKADVEHRHNASDITDLDDVLEEKLEGYATISYLNTALGNYVTTTALNTALATKADASHTHGISDVTGLQNSLNSKANSSDVYTKQQTYSQTEVDTLLEDKADWDDVYTKTETDTLLGGKANTVHTHAISNVTWLQGALDDKADSDHTHNISDVTWLQDALDSKADADDLADVATSGDYDDLTNKPTNLSDFANDTNFITNTVNDLVNYYNKSNTYSKTEVDELIGGITGIEVRVVQTLPATWENGVIYLVPNGGTGTNFYDEYIWVASQNKFEKLGTTEIDLSNYIQKTDNLLTINGVAYKQGQSLTTPNTTYDTLDASTIATGTETIGKLISAKLLKDAIANAISGKADSSDIKDSTITFKINNNAFTGNTFTLNQATWATINLSIDKATVGLGNVDNTADADKSVSHASTADNATNASYASNAGTVNNYTVNKDVPSNAKFTDTTYSKATANADGLMSKEDFNKLEGIETWAQQNKVTGVKWDSESTYRDGNINITKANIGLGSVDNTADSAKPVSTPQKTYIDNQDAKKYDKLVEVTVSTWATTTAKVGTTTSGSYVPKTWDLILINFVNGCSVSNPTLNIDSSWAKNIRVANANANTNTFDLGNTASSNVKILCIFDGTYYKALGSQNNTTYTVSDHKITLVQDGVELWYFTLNQNTDKTISRTSSGEGNELNATIVQNMIDIALGNNDNVFKTNSSLYKILNAIDDEDDLGLTTWETRNDIINNSASMNLISHSYAVMVNISNSAYAMEKLMEVSGAVDQVSQCRDSIYIIANNDKSANIYLGSATGIQYLFTYQQAQDAFFTNETRKQQIINDNIMVIVNSNTLLQSLYTDSVVAQAIAWNQTALNTIASNSTKLGIVDDSATIMDAIATNSGALGNMSDADFTTYILENTTYLTLTTSVTAGQNRINAMDADDLLPAIFYYTGLSWYSTFADLAANDWAIDIVQSNTNAMLIINCNDQALAYLDRQPGTNTIAYFPLEDNVTDKVQGLTLTTSWVKETLGRTFTATTTFSNRNTTSPTKFISVFLKINSGLNGTRCCTQLFDLGTTPCCYVTSHSDSVLRDTVHYNNGSSRPHANTWIQTGRRYHLAYGYYNGTIVMRVNGVKTTIGSNCMTTGGSNDFLRINGAGLNITVSKYIMESVGRTDEELTKYFNKYKDKYGIS